VGELVQDDEAVEDGGEEAFERLIPIVERVPAPAGASGEGATESCQSLRPGRIGRGVEEAAGALRQGVQEVGLALTPPPADHAQADVGLGEVANRTSPSHSRSRSKTCAGFGSSIT
jgi:hypothetical protein